MDIRTREKHIKALDSALQYFKGNLHVLDGTSVTAILENGGIAWAMLNHEFNRCDAMRLGYNAGKLDAKDEVRHLLSNSPTAKKIDFPNIGLGLVAES